MTEPTPEQIQEALDRARHANIGAPEHFHDGRSRYLIFVHVQMDNEEESGVTGGATGPVVDRARGDIVLSAVGRLATLPEDDPESVLLQRDPQFAIYSVWA